MNAMKSRIERELAEFDKAPHPPVKGTCVVMPIVLPAGEEGDDDGTTGPAFRLQFNGWSIDLYANMVWDFRDTARESASQPEAETDKIPTI